jgi:predicted phage terminase large subunit-like protein
MQRLHEDDMSGFCLSGNTGEDWEHVCLPALKDGKSLWPAKHSVQQLESMKKADPYTFAGQYGQRPSPSEGGIFKRHWWKFCQVVPSGARCVRGWDLAGSKNDKAAYSAGLKMWEAEGKYYIDSVIRLRGTPGEIEQTVLNTARADGIYCKVSLPQDPGAAGLTVKMNYEKLLAGFNFEVTPESGSKEDRARPFSAQCQAGNVYLIDGSWIKEFIEECANFPNGKYKDQVDAASRCFASLTAENVGEFTSDYAQTNINSNINIKDDW